MGFIGVSVDWGAVSAVVASGAAVWGAITASRGVSAWKRELTGRARFEASRKLLLAALRFRQAMAVMRSPFLSSHEFADRPNRDPESPPFTPDDRAYAYQQRRTPLADALVEAEALEIEASILCGEGLSAPVRRLRVQYAEVVTTVEFFIEYLREGGSNAEEFGIDLKESRRIMHGRSKDDAVADEIDNAIEELKRELKQHLR